MPHKYMHSRADQVDAELDAAGEFILNPPRSIPVPSTAEAIRIEASMRWNGVPPVLSK
jgi:hypothetical protein